MAYIYMYVHRYVYSGFVRIVEISSPLIELKVTKLQITSFEKFQCFGQNKVKNYVHMYTLTTSFVLFTRLG